MRGCGCLVLICLAGALGLSLPRLARFVSTPAENAQADARSRQIDRESEERRALLAKDPKAGHEAEICTASHHAVEDRLSNPRSAGFPSCIWNQSQVRYAGDGRYTFSAHVDAENGFGATVRSAYDGTAVISDDDLKARTFHISQLEIH